MFNPTEIVIDAIEKQLRDAYLRTYTNLEPSYPGIISFVGRMALEIIANSDAPYHDLNHTIAVTLVGQEVLKGKHLQDGGVSPRDWLHFTIALLCHDIGYVRGVCQHDRDGCFVINADFGGIKHRRSVPESYGTHWTWNSLDLQLDRRALCICASRRTRYATAPRERYRGLKHTGRDCHNPATSCRRTLT